MEGLSAALGPTSLFSNFTEAELGLIASLGVTRTYSKGSLVINCRQLIILKSPRVGW
jgi:hypothetical protein